MDDIEASFDGRHQDIGKNDTMHRLCKMLYSIGMRPVGGRRNVLSVRSWFLIGRESDGFWGVKRTSDEGQ